MLYLQNNIDKLYTFFVFLEWRYLSSNQPRCFKGLWNRCIEEPRSCDFYASSLGWGMNRLNTWFVFRLCGGAVGLACRLLEPPSVVYIARTKGSPSAPLQPGVWFESVFHVLLVHYFYKCLCIKCAVRVISVPWPYIVSVSELCKLNRRAKMDIWMEDVVCRTIIYYLL
jgi:hypothetical protein